MNRTQFFAAIKAPLFAGRFTQKQVEGIDAILDEAARRSMDLNPLAYVLATSWWETGRKMQPVREIGKGRGKPYGKKAGPFGLVYYGRGDVQLTWLDNYVKLGAALGIDLVGNPDRALENHISKAILFTGMSAGLFTGHRLSDYFGPGKADWRGARRIVNGMDKAAEIAKAAQRFAAALDAAGYGTDAKPAGRPAVADPAPPLPDVPPAAPAPLPPDLPDPVEDNPAAPPVLRVRFIVLAIVAAVLAAFIWRILS